MNYILLIVCSIILPVLSLKQVALTNQVTPKFCVNCKFFKNVEKTDNEFGKCTIFPRKEYNENFLVTGVEEIKEIDYMYCSTARENEYMCGKEGKKYKGRYKKKSELNINK